MPNQTKPAPRLSWTEVCARRLDRNALFTPLTGASPADIVSTMCGAHAQILTAAELSIGLRIAGITRKDIQEALWSRRSLVKTYGPRGTVHLLASADLPMWTGALSALPSFPRGNQEGVGLTPEQTEAIVAALDVVLADAELTADELTAALVDQVGPWAGEQIEGGFQGTWPRWRQALATAANRGALCFGPNKGRNVTYTHPRRWLPGFQPEGGQTALTGVVKRYLHAYGPATSQQFAQWLAVPREWAKELFDSLSDEIQQVEVEGALAWVVVGDTTAPSTVAQGVRLLPYFDAYVVGSHPRELLFPGRASKRALARGQAGNYPVLLIDGIVAGVWHQRRSGRKLDITVEPLQPLTAAQRRGLNDQVERIGEFLAATPRLAIGTVATGPHA